MPSLLSSRTISSPLAAISCLLLFGLVACGSSATNTPAALSKDAAGKDAPSDLSRDAADKDAIGPGSPDAPDAFTVADQSGAQADGASESGAAIDAGAQRWDTKRVDVDADPTEHIIDDAFRIDISTINLVFDYYPEQDYVDAQSTTTFTMRPGQTLPVIHFNPALQTPPTIPHLIKLDGESLDFAKTGDVKVFLAAGTDQKALEFERPLAPNAPHTLEMQYRLEKINGSPPYWRTHASDVNGIGDEGIFPTINYPAALARHTITFRVHSANEYLVVGSGKVTRTGATDVQEWTIDSTRAIASYAVFFAAVPLAKVDYQVQVIAGVEVRAIGFGGATPSKVFADLAKWLPQLQTDLGPFPMDTGLTVLLPTDTKEGMEYYGAVVADMGDLDHEVFHMYYDCTTMPRSYRDAWWDESINGWYGYQSRGEAALPLADTYTSNAVGGRSPIQIGFNRVLAYQDGVSMIAEVAKAVGGNRAMVGVLRNIHRDHSFQPFTTMQLADYIQDYTGFDVHAKFKQWMFTP
jgi:hypothetical protein